MNQTFVTTLPAKTAHRLSFLQPGTLRQVALAAALVVAAGQAAALGLGRLNVQSALGEALRAEIEVTSLTPEEASTLRARVAAPDAFRASGLDYNAVMAATQVQLVQQSNGRAVLRIVSNRAVQEPFLDLLLDIRWSNGRLNREFTLLFDPPVGGAAAPSSTPTPAPEPVAPVLSAPAPAPAAQPVPAPQRAQVAAALAAGTAPAASSAPRAAAVPPTAAPRAPRPQVAPAADPAPRAARADGLTVRPGDSLSRLAARSRLEGVSLDQMMAALYRENPNAFIGGNLNLLRAGAHLRMPSLDLAQQVDAEEARRLIRAHSTNFEQVRQNLAAAAPRLPAQNPQAVKGAVQARVDEPKMGSSSGDRLTLSKAGPAKFIPVVLTLPL